MRNAQSSLLWVVLSAMIAFGCTAPPSTDLEVDVDDRVAIARGGGSDLRVVVTARRATTPVVIALADAPPDLSAEPVTIDAAGVSGVLRLRATARLHRR